jgi:hypothetical protein
MNSAPRIGAVGGLGGAGFTGGKYRSLGFRICLAPCPGPQIVIVLERELVLGSVILGLKPVCYRVMPAALVQLPKLKADFEFELDYD